jgi:hypothetical protein
MKPALCQNVNTPAQQILAYGSSRDRAEVCRWAIIALFALNEQRKLPTLISNAIHHHEDNNLEQLITICTPQKLEHIFVTYQRAQITPLHVSVPLIY